MVGLIGKIPVPSLVGGLVLMALFAQILPGVGWAALSFCAFTILVLKVLATDAQRAFVLLYLVFYWFLMLFSGIFGESGAYMKEIGVTGYANGSTALLTALYGLLLVGMVKILNNFVPSVIENKIDGKSSFYIESIIAAWLVFLMIFGVYIGLKFGFPGLTLMDRFEFKYMVDHPLLNSFLHDRPIYAVFVSLFWMNSKGIKRIFWASLGIGIGILSFMLGEKFISVVAYAIFLALPWVVMGHLPQNKILQFVGKGGLIAILMATMAVLWMYGIAEDSTSAIERFTDRVASQAQLWFLATTQEPQLFAWVSDSLVNLWQSLWVLDGREVTLNPPYSGMAYLMGNNLVAERFHYFTTGITLAMGLEAYLLHVLGWFGLTLAMSGLAAVYACLAAYVYWAVRSADLVRIVVSVKLLIWANVAMTQGDLWFLFGLRFLILASLMLAYEVVRAQGLFKLQLLQFGTPKQP